MTCVYGPTVSTCAPQISFVHGVIHPFVSPSRFRWYLATFVWNLGLKIHILPKVSRLFLQAMNIFLVVFRLCGSPPITPLVNRNRNTSTKNSVRWSKLPLPLEKLPRRKVFQLDLLHRLLLLVHKKQPRKLVKARWKLLPGKGWETFGESLYVHVCIGYL